MGSENFERVSREPKVCSQRIDPVLMSLLKGQADLMQYLTEKVNRLSDAPKKQEDKIPPLSRKQLYTLSGVWNHPEWVMRAIHFLVCRHEGAVAG